jgi:hypothetical protein
MNDLCPKSQDEIIDFSIDDPAGLSGAAMNDHSPGANQRFLRQDGQTRESVPTSSACARRCPFIAFSRFGSAGAAITGALATENRPLPQRRYCDQPAIVSYLYASDRTYEGSVLILCGRPHRKDHR